MKKVMSYKNSCEEKGLNVSSNKSRGEYELYTNEIEKENSPELDDIYRAAQKIKNKTSKKK